jgi:FixJ family two-component response regulator
MGSRVPLIVVVDDEACIRGAILRLLQSASYAAEAFGSGVEFLASLSRWVPDCVILDLQMPDMTGLEVQRRLNEHHARLPIIVITGYDTPGTRDRCFALGAKHYLCKPVDTETLLSSIRDALGDQHAQHADAPGRARISPGDASVYHRPIG